ncbi:helix-turn-helix domain-containing protein [Dehalococcoidia bacterium]|nr:helix-turn-helix domain-containing protein [Dehalococcoidia bacterium]MCL0050961.1 helix-turn-helix domain-containing protein [Dehalococcoidia bacterium]MCL0070560.1 helix-turn-helix domain-containing protein [Dehalococcoidia bacterium]MCL0082028.1 helix-turn-helix domain-containing protein [Dehalococcoidia bacterium]MCL0095494.1 helix-turn-helix domain-containing protein [Dehalococcoidia bacterium]
MRTSRERLGLSQEELANRAGFSVHQMISQIEKGKREVKAWELVNLVKVLRYLHTFVQSGTRAPASGSLERSPEGRCRD